MEYRRLTADDVEAVARLAAEGLRPHLYPQQRFSPQKVRHVVEHFRRSDSDFHLVAFEHGAPVGAVAALAVESMFFERCEAVVVMCFAKAGGRRLVQALMDWARDDPRIRRVTWPLEPDASPAMTRYARMAGFNLFSQTATFLKG